VPAAAAAATASADPTQSKPALKLPAADAASIDSEERASLSFVVPQAPASGDAVAKVQSVEERYSFLGSSKGKYLGPMLFGALVRSFAIRSLSSDAHVHCAQYIRSSSACVRATSTGTKSSSD
jgi:hypothetical protein